MVFIAAVGEYISDNILDAEPSAHLPEIEASCSEPKDFMRLAPPRLMLTGIGVCSRHDAVVLVHGSSSGELLSHHLEMLTGAEVNVEQRN